MKRLLMIFPVLLLVWGASSMMNRPPKLPASTPVQSIPVVQPVQPAPAPAPAPAAPTPVAPDYWAARARYDALIQHLTALLDDSLFSSIELLGGSETEQLALEIWTGEAQAVVEAIDRYRAQNPGPDFVVYLKPATYSRAELRPALRDISDYAAREQLPLNTPPTLREDHILLSLPSEQAGLLEFLVAQGYDGMVQLRYQASGSTP